MRILVTGGTGFIGKPLVHRLLLRGDDVTVLSRRPTSVQAIFGEAAEAWDSLSAWTPDRAFDAVINLAGEPIIDRAWTDTRKQSLRNSRIGITGQLLSAMANATRKPAVFLSGSAIGIYGDTGSVDITEQAPAAGDFGARLCTEWEQAALPAEALGVRVCLLRTGLVLHADGGMLKKMQLPFKLGLGSRLGDGRQIMSWIHRHDYLNALLFLLDHPDCRGAFNLTAPMPVSNREFTAALAHSLHRKALLVTPEWALKPVLGERSLLLFGGQRVLPAALQAQGFDFRFTALADALENAGVN
ncbi:TIGR01777 family oxidoreductase [Arenimonas sp.]|jgi:uncharacterized protein (TIGR01777 family)|uniref:TIGR01777 family oxidoreductase n=1 Tax=Arenimonas sp. TaxID=1872635 RepID=UPI0037C16FC2